MHVHVGRHRAASCAWAAHVAGDYVSGLQLLPALGATALGPTAGAGGGGAGVSAGCAPAGLLVSTADGALTLFDIRGTRSSSSGSGSGGGGGGGGGAGVQRLASVSCGSTLRCCVADGSAALAGDEAGCVQLWDVGRVAGGLAAVREGGPGPDGLYAPWEGEEAGGSAVCGLDVYGVEAGEEGGAAGAVRVAVVTEGGRLVLLEA